MYDLVKAYLHLDSKDAERSINTLMKCCLVRSIVNNCTVEIALGGNPCDYKGGLFNIQVRPPFREGESSVNNQQIYSEIEMRILSWNISTPARRTKRRASC